MTLPTRFVDDAAVTARKLDYTLDPLTDFDAGCNQAASNSPGIGINVGVPNVAGTDEQYTFLDQDGDGRTPQVGQLIGGDGLDSGASGKGTDGIGVVTNHADGTGEETETGEATLVSLAAGWTSV